MSDGIGLVAVRQLVRSVSGARFRLALPYSCHICAPLLLHVYHGLYQVYYRHYWLQVYIKERQINRAVLNCIHMTHQVFDQHNTNAHSYPVVGTPDQSGYISYITIQHMAFSTSIFVS